jgi:hypothetical protein
LGGYHSRVAVLKIEGGLKNAEPSPVRASINYNL